MTEPPIRQAINLTLDTITRRTRGYRNLVVILAIVGMLVPLVAFLDGQWSWLTGLTVLMPLVSGWMFLDARLLRQWSHEITHICRDGALPLDVFTGTITAMRHLPQLTIGSMIELLRKKPAKTSESSATENSAGQPIHSEERDYRLITSLSAVGCLMLLAGLWTGWIALQGSGWLVWLISPFVPRFYSKVAVTLPHDEPNANQTLNPGEPEAIRPRTISSGTQSEG